MRRIFDFITNPSNSRTVGVLMVLIVVLAIPLTVNIAQKQQELRQRADTCKTINLGVFCSDVTGPGGVTCSPAGTSPGCPAGATAYSCTQQTCTTPTAPPTATPPTSPGPATGGNCPAGCTFQPTRCVGPMDDKQCTDAGCYNSSGILCTSTPTPTVSPTAPAVSCDASKGFVSTCTAADQQRGAVINGPCKRTCSAATAKAGQVVDGVSYKQCQTNLCWYDSYFDKTPTKIDEGKNNSGWCYAEPGKPDPCSIATVCPAAAGVMPTTQGGSAWGGLCPTEGEKQYAAVAGSNQCYYVSCEKFNSVATNPLCWFNSAVNSAPSFTCPNTPAAPTATKIQLTFTIGLDGIGTTVDLKCTQASCTNATGAIGPNKNPMHPTKKIDYEVFDSSNTRVLFTSVNLTYDQASGKFKGVDNIPTSIITGGNYNIKIKSDGYLKKTVPGLVNLGIGLPNNISSVNLATGDIDHDNKLSPLDYNFFSSCLFKPASGACAPADLDDNGVIDQFDYNLFVREISVIQNGD